jgi:hypothetical protein
VVGGSRLSQSIRAGPRGRMLRITDMARKRMRNSHKFRRRHGQIRQDSDAFI